MILPPLFDPRELEREKDVVLQDLGEARDTPGDIIFDDLQSAAFANQPLGRSILGDEASIAAITVEDLHGWRSGQYRAGGLALVAAGQVNHAELVGLADRHFVTLPGGGLEEGQDARFNGGDRFGRASRDSAKPSLGFAGPAQRDA